jgi:hypothetical protein
MDERPIDRPQFERRVAALCLRSGVPGLPRKRRDRAILFKSILLTLDSRATYTRETLREALAAWRAAVGLKVDIDLVTLRRALIDARLLTRDARGRAYRLVPGARLAAAFDPAVEGSDPAQVIAEARTALAERRERRRAAAAGRSAGSPRRAGA